MEMSPNEILKGGGSVGLRKEQEEREGEEKTKQKKRIGMISTASSLNTERKVRL